MIPRASAFGVSVLLLVYYTTVAFGVIYLVAIFHFTPARANALLNWSWAANVVSLLAGGLLSDWLRVRKPFMLVGGIGGMVFFIATIFLMRGRWSPAAAKADEEAHDAAVARELDALRRA